VIETEIFKRTSCGAITKDRRWIMASRLDLKNITQELTTWSERLHELSKKIDRIPSIDKYKLQPQIEELHMIMTELDDRLCQLITDDPGSLMGENGQGKVPGMRRGGNS
jgi:hypothetical protein